MFIKCTYCGKEFYKRPSEIKKDKRHFCCLQCRNEFFRAKKEEKERGMRHKSDFVNEFIIKESYSIMVINSKKYGRKEVLVDTDKIELLSKTFWHVAKMNDNYFCVVGWVKDLSKEMPIHRYLINCPPNKMVDHINRNPLDNRINNLRIVKHSENMLNRDVVPNNKLKHKGIRLHYNKYQARIMVNKNAISIGHFDTLQEAIIARENFCKEHKIIA